MSKITDTVELATSVVSDTKEIFELQLKLLRAEVQELGDFGKKMAFNCCIALALLLPAGFFLALALAALLNSASALPMWACYLIVFTLLVGASIPFVIKARRLAQERKSA